MFKTELRRDPGAADPRRFRKNCSIVLVGIVTIYVYNSKKRSKRISGADFELFFFFFNCLYTYIYKYIYTVSGFIIATEVRWTVRGHRPTTSIRIVYEINKRYDNLARLCFKNENGGVWEMEEGQT